MRQSFWLRVCLHRLFAGRGSGWNEVSAGWCCKARLLWSLQTSTTRRQQYPSPRFGSLFVHQFLFTARFLCSYSISFLKCAFRRRVIGFRCHVCRCPCEHRPVGPSGRREMGCLVLEARPCTERSQKHVRGRTYFGQLTKVAPCLTTPEYRPSSSPPVSLFSSLRLSPGMLPHCFWKTPIGGRATAFSWAITAAITMSNKERLRLASGAFR